MALDADDSQARTAAERPRRAAPRPPRDCVITQHAGGRPRRHVAAARPRAGDDVTRAPGAPRNAAAVVRVRTRAQARGSPGNPGGDGARDGGEVRPVRDGARGGPAVAPQEKGRWSSVFQLGQGPPAPVLSEVQCLL